MTDNIDEISSEYWAKGDPYGGQGYDTIGIEAQGARYAEEEDELTKKEEALKRAAREQKLLKEASKVRKMQLENHNDDNQRYDMRKDTARNTLLDGVGSLLEKDSSGDATGIVSGAVDQELVPHYAITPEQKQPDPTQLSQNFEIPQDIVNQNEANKAQALGRTEGIDNTANATNALTKTRERRRS